MTEVKTISLPLATLHPFHEKALKETLAPQSFLERFVYEKTFNPHLSERERKIRRLALAVLAAFVTLISFFTLYHIINKGLKIYRSYSYQTAAFLKRYQDIESLIKRLHVSYQNKETQADFDTLSEIINHEAASQLPPALMIASSLPSVKIPLSYYASTKSALYYKDAALETFSSKALYTLAEKYPAEIAQQIVDHITCPIERTRKKVWLHIRDSQLKEATALVEALDSLPHKISLLAYLSFAKNEDKQALDYLLSQPHKGLQLADLLDIRPHIQDPSLKKEINKAIKEVFDQLKPSLSEDLVEYLEVLITEA